MILHIGNNISILKNNILAILDYKIVETSEINKKFINELIEDGKLINKSKDIKSYIISIDDKKKSKRNLKLYTSNISSNTLFNRRML